MPKGILTKEEYINGLIAKCQRMDNAINTIELLLNNTIRYKNENYDDDEAYATFYERAFAYKKCLRILKGEE